MRARGELTRAANARAGRRAQHVHRRVTKLAAHAQPAHAHKKNGARKATNQQHAPIPQILTTVHAEGTLSARTVQHTICATEARSADQPARAHKTRARCDRTTAANPGHKADAHTARPCAAL